MGRGKGVPDSNFHKKKKKGNRKGKGKGNIYTLDVDQAKSCCKNEIKSICIPPQSSIIKVCLGLIFLGRTTGVCHGYV